LKEALHERAHMLAVVRRCPVRAHVHMHGGQTGRAGPGGRMARSRHADWASNAHTSDDCARHHSARRQSCWNAPGQVNITVLHDATTAARAGHERATISFLPPLPFMPTTPVASCGRIRTLANRTLARSCEASSRARTHLITSPHPPALLFSHPRRSRSHPQPRNPPWPSLAAHAAHGSWASAAAATMQRHHPLPMGGAPLLPLGPALKPPSPPPW
jgi:hypothetical protein